MRACAVGAFENMTAEAMDRQAAGKGVRPIGAGGAPAATNFTYRPDISGKRGDRRRALE
jgi:hypothetical protein